MRFNEDMSDIFNFYLFIVKKAYKVWHRA